MGERMHGGARRGRRVGNLIVYANVDPGKPLAKSVGEGGLSLAAPVAAQERPGAQGGKGRPGGQVPENRVAAQERPGAAGGARVARGG